MLVVHWDFFHVLNQVVISNSYFIYSTNIFSHPLLLSIVLFQVIGILRFKFSQDYILLYRHSSQFIKGQKYIFNLRVLDVVSYKQLVKDLVCLLLKILSHLFLHTLCFLKCINHKIKIQSYVQHKYVMSKNIAGVLNLSIHQKMAKLWPHSC